MLSDCKSDRTLQEAPRAYFGSFVRADLKSACLNIGICNPAIQFIALQMLIFNAVGLQIRQNITGSALCLFRKRPVLISEAPCGYFGSAGRSEALSVLFHAKVSSITMYLAKKTELFWGNQS